MEVKDTIIIHARGPLYSSAVLLCIELSCSAPFPYVFLLLVIVVVRNPLPTDHVLSK
jgi:hypothetical protein